ncbi:amino acid ABC transporter substrate-binding protein [Brucella pituitosa]|uniref:Amino acid ABC transporter substrate-binding protein n=1 Tax=Brucella pituitosa TaxID=571256 RepID=A0ABS3K2N5_9HYPH|nr:amino acid ABC transporter substrate-binding protein [Brucella pituitosa]MBO1041164.1 amino acid ABC transporter substrate-binding protein [Brucella pituitosa]
MKINILTAGMVFIAALTASTASFAETPSTLANVKKAGVLKCGSNGQLAGFSTIETSGKWIGMDADFCRAVAAAVLGDAEKTEFMALTSQQRFPAVQSGEINLLSHSTTATLTREASVGMLFAKPMYYDGQAFIVKKSLGVSSAKELDGASICVRPGTVTEQIIADFGRANGIKLEPVVIEQQQQVVDAFLNDRCVAFTDDSSALASVRAEQANPDDLVILPEILSKEPLSPGVRADDPRWYMIVSWVRDGLVAAEELGVTQANVDEMKSSQDPAIQRLLGASGDLGSLMGLENDWMYNAIKAVGNYGEIFERNLGGGSPLKLKRGINDQWKNGGLLYAYPLI